MFALENIGAMEDQGKVDAAREQFKRLTETPFQNYKDRGLYHLARLEQKSGNVDKARSQYEAISKDFPESPLLRDVQTRLSMLPPSASAKASADKPKAEPKKEVNPETKKEAKPEPKNSSGKPSEDRPKDKKPDA